jgi:hypothetical protein
LQVCVQRESDHVTWFSPAFELKPSVTLNCIFVICGGL